MTWRVNHHLIRLVAPLALGLPVLAGCGQPEADYDDLDLAQVSGTVTLDGEPLAGATVVFEADDHTKCYGTTDDAGEYTLMFNSEQAGCSPGKKTVRITTATGFGEESEEPEGEGEGGEGVERPEEPIPARYNTASELSVEVTAGEQTHDFPLKSQ